MADPKTTDTPAVPATPETPADATVTPATDPAPAAPVEKAADAPAADGTVAAQPATTSTFPDVTALVGEAVTKAIDGVKTTFDSQIAELKATSDATIAKLQDQVTKLSAEPQSGGPVANAHAAVVIEKGGQAMADLLNDTGVAERVIAGLEEVAKSTTDPAARQALAEQSLALRLQHGIGAVYVPIASQR